MIALNASIADCYHQGHDNIFKTMRETGKKTIVILHDDLACYKIKRKFPIQELKHRIRNLKRSGLVDKVLVTHSTDPADMFAKVVKKYGAENIEYFRGDDLTKDFLGQWYLDKVGVKITFLPYTKGVSSTQIRDEICR
jgi:glycerol-3-phosphate cytidylyltransferase-like family protein